MTAQGSPDLRHNSSRGKSSVNTWASAIGPSGPSTAEARYGRFRAALLTAAELSGPAAGGTDGR